MVGSALCNRELQLHSADTENKIPQGCFVIRGGLKVIPPLKRANWNNPIVVKKRDSKHLTLEVRSCHESRQSFSTYNTRLILSNSGDDCPYLDKRLNVNLSFFAKKKHVPCVVLFQALGWTPRDAFFAIRFMAGIHWNNEMTVLVRTLLTDLSISAMEEKHDEKENGPFDPTEAALKLITEKSTRSFDTPQKNRDFIIRGLTNEFLPQVGIPNSNDGDSEKELNYRKGIELASYAVQLLLVDFGIKEVDCRDHFAFCRMDSVGTLVSSLFRQVYSQNLKKAQTQLKKAIEKKDEISIQKIVGNGKISARILYCFSTGTWGSRRSGCNRHNVSQALQLFNRQAQLGHMGFFYTTRSTEGKIVSLRQIHPSQAFKICPAATPEGKQCGIVANGVCGFMLTNGSSAAYLTAYLIGANENIVKIQNWRQLCVKLGWEHLQRHDVGYTAIRVNGTCIGFLDREKSSLQEFYDWFSERRRRLDIDPFASISHTIDKIDIYCDRDRVSRFVIKKSEIPRLASFLNVQPSPIELVAAGVGIFLDANEEKVVSICASLEDENADKYDFVELDPSCMLSILAAAIPFCNFNQAPRNTYQVSMGKAACGRGLHRDVMLTQRYELSYPQKPLTNTMITRAFQPTFRNFGVNCVVAVKMHDGYPQEDSTVVNKSFLERGGLATNHTRLYRDSSKRGSAADRQFYGKINPKVTSGMKMANYNKIQSNGLPSPGEQIENGDIVIGKANRIGKASKAQFRCTSVAHSGDTGRVEKTICTFGADAQAVRKVTVRSERSPEIGDKISSRHGQKTTIGLIERQEDMPFDEETGMSPDVIISPTALPSRMTIGMWQEFVTSTLAAMTGEVQDATPFRKFEKERIDKEFELLGMAKPCTRRLRDGRTGRLMTCRIYTGLVYLQVLKQFSKDKLHARARGPRNILTRAPLEGRSRDGGLRIGAMERDCLFAYGASNLVHSRMLLHSDVSTEYFCKRCGFKAIANHQKGIYTCQACGPYAQIREIEVSRAFAVFLDELQALMISTRLQLEDEETEEEVQKQYRDEVMGHLDRYETRARRPQIKTEDFF